jgi:hypothetical protein
MGSPVQWSEIERDCLFPAGMRVRSAQLRSDQATMGVNLWNPPAGLSVGTILLTAFLLGIVHGITPDEHTWPITFSYATGSYSTRRGLLSGVAFSGAFTVQRALACVLAYVALARLLQDQRVNAVVDLLVGVAMAAAGAYILRLGRAAHVHLTLPFRRCRERRLVPGADVPDAADDRHQGPRGARTHR